MDAFRTRLEAIEATDFDEWTKEILIREMPKTSFVGSFPPEMAFLQRAFVDLGFE